MHVARIYIKHVSIFLWFLTFFCEINTKIFFNRKRNFSKMLILLYFTVLLLISAKMSAKFLQRIYSQQRRIQNPVEHLRWRFLRKYLTVFSRYFPRSSNLDVRLGLAKLRCSNLQNFGVKHYVKYTFRLRTPCRLPVPNPKSWKYLWQI